MHNDLMHNDLMHNDLMHDDLMHDNASTALVHRPRRPPAAVRAAQWACDVPGRVVDFVTRPVPPQSPQPDLRALEHLIRQSPRANAYLSLEPGLNYVREEDVLLSYRTTGRYAFATGGVHGLLGSGAPVGSQLRSIRDQLVQTGHRRILIFPVAQAERDAVAEAGFKTLTIGAEAMLNPQEFDLRGRGKADVRQMCNRARKRYQLQCREVELSTERRQLEGIYGEWLADRPAGHAMHLLIGTPCFDAPFGRRFFGAFDPAGVCRAFVTVTPGWNGRGWGIDVMARGHAAPAGAMDLLLVSVIETLASEGSTRLSLGASPLYTPRYDCPEFRNVQPWHLKTIFRVLYSTRLGNLLFPFKGLKYFKDKFEPSWQPVFMAGWPNVGVWSLYVGCRLWGLFRSDGLGPSKQIGANSAASQSI